MFTLKNYQRDTLEALEQFLGLARLVGPAEAFARCVAANPTDRRPQRYVPKPGLEAVPYVCLRLPTGGGKTYLAAHSVGIAARNYMDRDFPLALWLVPTNTIRQQTADALKDHAHPCRKALAAAFGLDRVAVFDIADVNSVRPKDLSDKACIVVATYQTLRVSDANKEKRKVYGHNENFEPHFKALPNTAPGLDRDEKGSALFSFVNLLHQIRPLIIADEAHKAISDLSGEMLQRINPACILEFTATPVESNILYRVFASQLKAEEMVKLPFVLTEHNDWEQAINGAVQTRKKLQELAPGEDPNEHVRPILLIQAEEKNRERTVDVVKRHLMDNEAVAESEIAIATGEQRELDKINLFDKTCPINYVITMEALKEGWDCSFAYVFCSVANVQSPTDVEQLLGRVMRMPYARRRRVPELNKAYAHVISPSFARAADEMHAHLTSMGFHEDEAAAYIEPQSLTLGGVDPDKYPLFREQGPPVLEVILDKDPALDALPTEEKQGLQVSRNQDGTYTLRTEAPLSEVAEETLVMAAPKREGEIRRSAALHRERVRRHAQRNPTPSERGEQFRIPQLRLEIFGGMEEPGPEAILIASGWSPLVHPARFEPNEFRYDETARTFIFDLEGEQMRYQEASNQVQLTLLAGYTDWTDLRLSRWLCEQCRQNDIRYEDLLEFCRKCLHALLERGDFDLPALIRAKYALAAAMKAKLERLRMEGLKRGYQELLFSSQAKVEVSFTYTHDFPASGYADNAPAYPNEKYRFRKHFHPVVRDLKDRGEEFDCARLLDSHPKVAWWVRNVDRKAGSFSLPLSNGHNFYPDFIARLDDGRILVVEYKGAHLEDMEEEQEKKNIGELWQEKSNDVALFLWATKTDEAGRDTQRQLADKLAMKK